MPDICCSECGSSFNQRKNLYTHLRKIHSRVGDSDPVQKKLKLDFLCQYCPEKFSHKSSLKRHQIHKHSENEPKATRNSRLFCPEVNCSEIFGLYSLLRKHLTESHSMNLPGENYEFNNMREFEKWKEEMEKETISFYSQDTSEKQLADGCKKRYFSCFRSYSYQSKGKNTRVLKSLGSNKTGKACPSKMEIEYIDDNSTVSVKYWPTHCGHTSELARKFLDDENRAKIAAVFKGKQQHQLCVEHCKKKLKLSTTTAFTFHWKLKAGVSMERILSDIRDEYIDEDSLERIHLVDRQDLRNITRDFNIDYATKKHKNDAASVKLWVEEMRAMGDDCPVLYYKAQNEEDTNTYLKKEDFALVIKNSFQMQQLKKFGHEKICIDGTQGTNPYDIQLYTIVIVDEFGCECPVAFCFSNRADEYIFKLFFENVKSKVGEIKTNVFMSDDAPAFYNAWLSVMGEACNTFMYLACGPQLVTKSEQNN